MVRLVRFGVCVLPFVVLCLVSCGGDDGTSSSAKEPDLAIQSASISPAAPLDGQDVTVHAVIQNIGDATAELSHVRLKLGGTVLCGTLATPILEPGDTSGVTCQTGELATGSYEVGVCSDVLNLVMEADESNNCRNVPIEVTERTVPDLIVQEITYTPAVPDEGDSVTVKVKVLNLGTPADTTHTRIRLDGAVTCGSIVTRDLNRGASVTLTCQVGRLALGTHAVEACVDHEGEVVESDETNNCLEKPLIVSAGLPDLVISRLYWTPLNPTSADSISFYATVKNLGVGASGASSINFTIGAFFYQPRPIPVIAAGDSITVVGPRRRLVAGEYDILSAVDPTLSVRELDENNNNAVEALIVRMGKK